MIEKQNSWWSYIVSVSATYVAHCMQQYTVQNALILKALSPPSGEMYQSPLLLVQPFKAGKFSLY